ncbi:MAG: hypothetical protein ACRDV0_07280 [Acidimicrobiales bacterium]
MVPLALVTGAAMLVAWFPLTSLWHQQSQIDAVNSQIALIRSQQRTLSAESRSISTTAAATELARQQYQLVQPGQSLIQVLPGHEAGHPTTAGGDPGFQPLVSPSSVSSLVAPLRDRVTTTRPSSLRAFLTRLTHTLEFWH